MKTVYKGDNYHPAIGELFVLVYKGVPHLVKMGRCDTCNECPMYELPYVDECNQYVDCSGFSADYHLISVEEDLE